MTVATADCRSAPNTEAMDDTIVALATPLGRSGIGVIRLSGGRSLDIAGKLVGKKDFSPNQRSAVLEKILETDDGEVIDTALITFFKSPNSFTGEDVVEISCHGSPVVLRQVLDLCLSHDARMAEPGEFSLRALSNGRINLAQAEAVRDLIDSQTVAAARQSVRQLEGAFSKELQPLKDDLLNVIIVLESALEFVEDDLPAVQTERIKSTLREIASRTSELASTYKAGKLIREGLRVALVGRPNVGKSSLFNRFLGQDRAIVTDIAGTTRDQIHERFTIGDIPVSLIDTAGLRDTTDTVEKIGVERSRQTMADADLVLVLIDGSEAMTAEDRGIIESASRLNHLIVVNKTDLGTAVMEIDEERVVRISAKTGEGIDALAAAVVEPFESSSADLSGFLVSDARHHDLLSRCETEIGAAIDLLDARASEELVLVGLHNALRYLGQITGETTTEDMLTRIFSTFCIGK